MMAHNTAAERAKFQSQLLKPAIIG